MMKSNRIYKFLAVLNVEFDEVRGKIIGRQPLPLIGEVFSKVRWEKSRWNVMLIKKGIGTPLENSALTTTDVHVTRSYNNQRKTEEKPQV